MARKTETTMEREQRRTAEFRRRFEAHQKAHPEWRMRGWKARLAEATGLDASVVSRVLTGARPASIDHIALIASAVGAPEIIPPEVLPGASGHPVIKAGNQDLPDRGSEGRSKVPPSLDAYLEKHGDKISHKDAQLAARLGFKLDAEAPELDPERFWNGVFEAIRKSRKGA